LAGVPATEQWIISPNFDVVKSTVSDTITLVENVLIQDGRFRCQAKKRWFPRKTPVESWPSMSRKVRLNVQKKQKKWYSCKKKRHTMQHFLLLMAQNYRRC
jgi:hypothetical protein